MALIQRFRAGRRARAVRADLARLDDRSLRDAGIPRWCIREIARGGAVDPRLVL